MNNNLAFQFDIIQQKLQPASLVTFTRIMKVKFSALRLPFYKTNTMKIFRAIIIGAVTGAALFFLPFFILRGLLFILFIGFVIRLIAFGAWRRRGFGGRGFNLRFADKIRSMSDEEYSHFKQNFSYGYGREYRKGNQPETIVMVD